MSVFPPPLYSRSMNEYGGKSQRQGLSLNVSPCQDSSNAYNTPTEYMWSARDLLPLTDVNDLDPTAPATGLAGAAIGSSAALTERRRTVPGLTLPARSGP